MLLVEAPISAFPDDSLDLDLPKGAKDCLAALKRLKPDSSAETKETFLGKWFEVCTRVYIVINGTRHI